MASSAQYVATAVTSAALLTAANPSRNGTGTVVTLYPAQVVDSRVDDINIQALGTTTAGAVRIFLKNGANFYLLRDIAVEAVVASASVPAFSLQLLNLAWILAPGWELVASTEKAESFAVTVTRGGAV